MVLDGTKKTIIKLTSVCVGAFLAGITIGVLAGTLKSCYLVIIIVIIFIVIIIIVIIIIAAVIIIIIKNANISVRVQKSAVAGCTRPGFGWNGCLKKHFFKRFNCSNIR